MQEVARRFGCLEAELRYVGKAIVHKNVVLGPNVRINGPAWIRGGHFFGGNFFDGTIFNGVFNSGTFHGGTFYGGTFNGGHFEGGDFCSGSFNDGCFHGGVFDGPHISGGVYIRPRIDSGQFFAGTYHHGRFMSAPPVIMIDGIHYTIGAPDHVSCGLSLVPFAEAERKYVTIFQDWLIKNPGTIT